MAITHNLFVAPGYEIESVPGTDVATTRVAFTGGLEDWRMESSYPKEVETAPGSQLPANMYGTWLDWQFHLRMKPYTDAGANSLIGLLLGTINTTSGVITTATTQTTFTVQGGLDLSTDYYRRMRYCMVTNLRRQFAFGQPTIDDYTIRGISRPTADTQATAYAAAPTLATGSPWVSPGQVSATFSSGLTYSGTVEGGTIEVDRNVQLNPGLHQTDVVPTSLYTGGVMGVSGTVTLLPDDLAALTSYLLEPNASGGNFTLTVNFTKNSNAQYSDWVITKVFLRDPDIIHWRRNSSEGLTVQVPWEMGGGGTLSVDTVA